MPFLETAGLIVSKVVLQTQRRPYTYSLVGKCVCVTRSHARQHSRSHPDIREIFVRTKTTTSSSCSFNDTKL